MAFQVNTLPDYVEQHKGELLSKAVFGFETQKFVNLQTGVKYKEALNILATDPILQARTCAFDASGNVTFTQRIIEVKPYKVNMELCEDDLRKKWMNDEIAVKAGAEVLPLEEKITEDIVKKVQKQLENLIWQGNSSSNAVQFNGFVTIAAAEADVVDVSAGSTVYGTVLNVYQAIPEEILDEAEIFCGNDDFRALCIELTAKNLYHYDPKVDAERTIIIPGTSTKIHGVNGLNGSHRMLATDPRNLYYGVDMADDAESFDLWYSKDNQTFRLAIKFNAGAQIAFPDEVVLSEAPAE